MRLRITCEDLTPRSARVYLDDLDVSAALKAVSLTMVKGQVNEATITIDVFDVDVDARALGMLSAHLRARALSGGET